MKKIFAALTLITLAACGRGHSESQVKFQVPSVRFGFQKDFRPVDGSLTQLFIVQNRDQATYTLTIKKTLPRGASKSETIGNEFTCKIISSRAGANKIECSVDKRPVDGALVTVYVVKNSSNYYEATQETKFFDRRSGKEIVNKLVIGTGMSSF